MARRGALLRAEAPPLFGETFLGEGSFEGAECALVVTVADLEVEVFAQSFGVSVDAEHPATPELEDAVEEEESVSKRQGRDVRPPMNALVKVVLAPAAAGISRLDRRVVAHVQGPAVVAAGHQKHVPTGVVLDLRLDELGGDPGVGFRVVARVAGFAAGTLVLGQLEHADFATLAPGLGVARGLLHGERGEHDRGHGDAVDLGVACDGFEEVQVLGAGLVRAVVHRERLVEGDGDDVGHGDSGRGPFAARVLLDAAVHPVEGAVGTGGLGDGFYCKGQSGALVSIN